MLCFYMQKKDKTVVMLGLLDIRYTEHTFYFVTKFKDCEKFFPYLLTWDVVLSKRDNSTHDIFILGVLSTFYDILLKIWRY